jgi:hypothetical protein
MRYLANRVKKYNLTAVNKKNMIKQICHNNKHDTNPKQIHRSQQER